MTTEERLKQILELRKKKFSLRKIGSLLNISGERVRQIIKGKTKKVRVALPPKKCQICDEMIIFQTTDRYRKYCQKCSENLKHFSGRDMVREKVRMRDKYTCQKCGKIWNDEMRRFDIHHLNGDCGKYSRKYDRVCNVDGLITLCHKCHFNHPEHSQRKKMIDIYGEDYTPIDRETCKFKNRKLNVRNIP